MAMFVSAEFGISLAEGDLLVAPESAYSPISGRGLFQLIASDAIFLDDEAQSVAIYEQPARSRWMRAMRNAGETEAEQPIGADQENSASNQAPNENAE